MCTFIYPVLHKFIYMFMPCIHIIDHFIIQYNVPSFTQYNTRYLLTRITHNSQSGISCSTCHVYFHLPCFTYILIHVYTRYTYYIRFYTVIPCTFFCNKIIQGAFFRYLLLGTSIVCVQKATIIHTFRESQGPEGVWVHIWVGIC